MLYVATFKDVDVSEIIKLHLPALYIHIHSRVVQQKCAGPIYTHIHTHSSACLLEYAKYYIFILLNKNLKSNINVLFNFKSPLLLALHVKYKNVMKLKI